MGAFPSYRLLVVLIIIFLSDVGPATSCLESERQALLAFKGGLVDESNWLGSWVDVGGGSCCDWYGVSCNNSTGHVNTLDLSECYFQEGPIPDGLQNLSSLRSLDLSGNYFNSSIPSWLYGFSSGLEILNLEYNRLQGVISSAIRNLTSLSYLELGLNSGLEIGGREIIKSMGQLCRLKYLGLSGVKVNQDVVDIWRDLFSSTCPSNGLEFMDLSYAGIFGNLNGVSFQRFKSLVRLYLQNNSISGSIPPSFGELRSLESADLGGNSMVGSVSEPHFAKLVGLKYFSASGNKLELKVSPNWIPPFQLVDLDLSSWQLGKEFPPWLHSQKNIQVLYLSSCGIEGTIPEWLGKMSSQLLDLELRNNQLKGEVPIIFSSNLENLDLSNNSIESISKEFWNFSRSLTYLNLSYNQIDGEIPRGHLMTFSGGGTVDLSSNKFHGRLPPFSSNLTALDVSGNSFSGSLSHFLCYQMNVTKQMQALNLGNNFLTGEIPNCWLPWEQLSGVKLNNNNFNGRIPSSMQDLSSLESLHLRNNNLSGGLPLLLRSFQMLITVDLAENHFQGEIPSWIGPTNMKILSLRSNKLEGKVPHEICALGALQILDLANNNLSGEVPKCISNFAAMINGFSDRGTTFEGDGGYLDNAILVIKGRVMEYTTTLNLVRIVDFSDNFFTGKIPNEVTDLAALQSLNLSHNILTGEIPQNIGAMKLLESLDLSGNKLVGEIPSSISSLNFLNHLNLSSNNLTGPIPSSTQLQSFDASCFADNDHLCGPPLANECDEKHTFPVSRDADGEGMSTYLDMEGFFVSMAFGFVFGFWLFLLPLFCNRQWRMAFFSFLDSVGIFICKFANLDM